MAKVNLAAPWTTCYRQFQAFFKNDPSVKVEYNSNGPEIKLYVECPQKAEALTQLLEPTRTFGNITLKITVIPANNPGDDPGCDLVGMPDDIARIKTAVYGNKAVYEIVDIKQEFITNPLTYVVFKKEVVQFFNDNLSDLHGLTSTLYQDLAEAIFTEHSGVCFCTAANTGLGAPLGEWP